jgi:hypothetical protein
MTPSLQTLVSVRLISRVLPVARTSPRTTSQPNLETTAMSRTASAVNDLGRATSQPREATAGPVVRLGCAAENALVFSYPDLAQAAAENLEGVDRVHAVPLGPPLNVAAVCGWRYRPGALQIDRDWATTSVA